MLRTGSLSRLRCTMSIAHKTVIKVWIVTPQRVLGLRNSESKSVTVTMPTQCSRFVNNGQCGNLLLKHQFQRVTHRCGGADAMNLSRHHLLNFDACARPSFPTSALSVCEYARSGRFAHWHQASDSRILSIIFFSVDRDLTETENPSRSVSDAVCLLEHLVRKACSHASSLIVFWTACA